jgi:hypothetical protein
VADTYNNKIKAIDPRSTATQTIAGTGEPGLADNPPQFDEPAGIDVADGKLYVADTNNHAIRVIELKGGHRVQTLVIAGLQPPAKPAAAATTAPQPDKVVTLERQAVKPTDGTIRLTATLQLPTGWKMNALAPMSYRVEAGPGTAGVVRRDDLGKPAKVQPPAPSFDVVLPVSAATGDDQVRVVLNYYYCQEANEGLCKVGSVAWEVPLTVAADGKPAVSLDFKVE